MIAQVIEKLLSERFKEPDLADCYVVEVKELPTKRFEVYLDSDDGISYEKCVKVSRYLEQYLDENPQIGEKYVLDVSSAGVGRPLKFKRQYVKNIGRTLKIKTTDNEVINGELKAVDDEKIQIEIKNKKEVSTKELLFSQIKEAKIKVRF